MQDCILGYDCPIPVNPVASWCELFPNPSCASNNGTSGFTFPRNFSNDGDIFIQRALLWCMWFNNGACLGGGTDIGIGITGQNCSLDDPFCGIIIIPGVSTPLSGLSDEQLSELCKAGQGVFNEACQELLRRCNAGNRRACTLRSTCDADYEMFLENEMHEICDNRPRCNGHDSCEDLFTKILINQRCKDARWNVANECYQGVMDRYHEEQIWYAQQVEAECLVFLFANEAQIRQYGANRAPCNEYWDRPEIYYLA